MAVIASGLVIREDKHLAASRPQSGTHTTSPSHAHSKSGQNTLTLRSVANTAYDLCVSKHWTAETHMTIGVRRRRESEGLPTENRTKYHIVRVYYDWTDGRF